MKVFMRKTKAKAENKTGVMNIGVSGILTDARGRVLLVKRSASESLAGQWCTPGGGVEFGETLRDALLREFWEEVGVKLDFSSPELVCVEERISRQHTVLAFFEVMNPKNWEPKARSEEVAEVGWFGRRSISRMRAQGSLTELTSRALLKFEALGKLRKARDDDRKALAGANLPPVERVQDVYKLTQLRAEVERLQAENARLLAERAERDQLRDENAEWRARYIEQGLQVTRLRNALERLFEVSQNPK